MTAAPPPPDPDAAPGILPSQALRRALDRGWIAGSPPVEDGQVQPASLDLRLGARAWRVRASLLPGRSTVAEKIARHALYEIRLDAGDGAVLEQDCVYIVELAERLALPDDVSALANPKSSTGRLDVFARVITDRGTEFDQVRPGYEGPLHVEIAPRSFPIRVRPGSRLAQLRLRRGAPDGHPGDGRIPFTVDLVGQGDGALIGYKARTGAGLIDVDRVAAYPWSDFWEPVHASPDGIVLEPNDFYILASKEAVAVPADHAAEMLAYDTLVGEFRVHYAGFFDPGFGIAEAGGQGSRAVLEVRARDVPFVVEDGQVVGRLVYERLAERPDRLYGQGIRSNYQGQGLQLAKQFRR